MATAHVRVVPRHRVYAFLGMPPTGLTGPLLYAHRLDTSRRTLPKPDYLSYTYSKTSAKTTAFSPAKSSLESYSESCSGFAPDSLVLASYSSIATRFPPNPHILPTKAAEYGVGGDSFTYAF